MAKIVVKDAVVVNLEETNINVMEKLIRGELQLAGLRIMEKAFKTIEARKLKSRPFCECGGEWRNKGRVLRQIFTVLGKIKYRRLRLRCLSCGTYYYPLDDGLGLQADKNITLGLTEQVLHLATDTPYDKASKNLKKLGGVEISGRQIQNLAKEEGEKIKEIARKEREQIFEKGCVPESKEKRKRVFVEIDGTFVKERSKPRSVECKVGVIYSDKVKVSKNRIRILDKRTYATIENLDTFREEFIAECNKWGVWDAEEILYMSDGASWIKKMCKDDFPGATYLLDFWHLAENISRTLGEEHRRAADNWIEEVKTTYDAKLLLKRIKGLYPRIRDPDMLEKLRKLYGYVKNNEEGIENWKKVNCLGSSGAIEKTVDITVARRFKNRGMSWLQEGISGLLSLRLLKLNGEWDDYWKAKGVPL